MIKVKMFTTSELPFRCLIYLSYIGCVSDNQINSYVVGEFQKECKDKQTSGMVIGRSEGEKLAFSREVDMWFESQNVKMGEMVVIALD